MPTTWTIGRKIASGFAISLVALFVIGWISYRSLDVLIGASTQVTQTNLARTGLSDLLSLLKDAETGQRGFVITGDETFLEPYASGTTEAPKVPGPAAPASSRSTVRNVRSSIRSRPWSRRSWPNSSAPSRCGGRRVSRRPRRWWPRARASISWMSCARSSDASTRISGISWNGRPRRSTTHPAAPRRPSSPVR